MREESHLDEMRTAIRGDFERLAERRGEQDLMRVTDEEAPEASIEADAPETALEPPEAEPEPEAQPELELEPEPKPEQRSWLARLFSPP
jgi:hypothetical protein